MRTPDSNAYDCCACDQVEHEPRLVVLTGGPGAGKTAVLEVVRRDFCEHIAVLPEAASILFGGGFPRQDGRAAQRAAQRAIYHVQHELERMVLEERRAAVALCDRGTLDGLAYWNDPSESYLAQVGTSLEAELKRYAAVIHLRTPAEQGGYNRRNPVRTEDARQAAALDERILAAWSAHPRRYVVESTPDFMTKLIRTVELLRAELPPCCQRHELGPLHATT